MELSIEQIKHIAALSRLDIKPEEEEAFREKISSVLEYLGQLSECETDGVEPMAHVVPLVNAWRPDEIVGCDGETRKKLIDAFPDKEGDLLKVKAVFS